MVANGLNGHKKRDGEVSLHFKLEVNGVGLFKCFHS
jgi:hypothetical protein